MGTETDLHIFNGQSLPIHTYLAGDVPGHRLVVFLERRLKREAVSYKQLTHATKKDVLIWGVAG